MLRILWATDDSRRYATAFSFQNRRGWLYLAGTFNALYCASSSRADWSLLELAPQKTLHLEAGQTDPYESSCLVEGDILQMAGCCSRTIKHSYKFIAN